MAAIVSLEGISKSFTAEPLFSDLRMTIQDGERVGMIGPNGAGKSTLLKIFFGTLDADEGNVLRRRDARLAYSAQSDDFDLEQTAYDILCAAVADLDLEDYEVAARADRLLSELKIDADVTAGSLSGGWRKRLHLACGLMQEADCWLVDEPTNHLDLDGCLWIQQRVESYPNTVIMISHDRYFLEQSVSRTIEIDHHYAEGYFSSRCGYRQFLVDRDLYFDSLRKKEESMSNKYRREAEWLSRRPKARTTKSQSRIKKAGELKDDLDNVKSRNKQARLGDIGFQESGRRSQDLLVCEGVHKSYGDGDDKKIVLKNIDLHLSAGVRLGLLGRNGSGKTTLLKILSGEVEADSGNIKRAYELKAIRFSQDRSQLNLQHTLRQALSDNEDTVVYQGRNIHINAWSQMFLFKREQLEQKISSLSGGEQARVLLSQMMRKEADVLILDEPTNDLDIPALEVLESSLLDFKGAIILVTHDRFLLEEVATDFLAICDDHSAIRVGSYAQWEDAQKRLKGGADGTLSEENDGEEPIVELTWAEQKELRGIEKKIANAEVRLEKIQERLADDKVLSDVAAFAKAQAESTTAEEKLKEMYARWEDLESRSS
ncbi:MAG: ABC-F family ATP-binding cassette domain-containing protein [Planctomycetes bacterium]|nr:ABC-F family ATP-binding cassette domain-containing protein [Planctomycetota bacterium]